MKVPRTFTQFVSKMSRVYTSINSSKGMFNAIIICKHLEMVVKARKAFVRNCTAIVFFFYRIIAVSLQYVTDNFRVDYNRVTDCSELLLAF
jgi:hypothetical protein